MWANISRWTVDAERIETEGFLDEALADASELVSRQPGFVQFECIRTAPDVLVVVTRWKSAAAARKAATLTPLVRDFYTKYVSSAELETGELVMLREASQPAKPE